MALNFLNSGRSSTSEETGANEPDTTTTTNSTEEASAAPARRRRRGSRGGRSNATTTTTTAAPEAADDEEAPARPSRRRAPAKASDDDEEATPRPAPRRRAPAKASDGDEEATPRPAPRRRAPAKASDGDEEATPRPAPRRRAPAKASDGEEAPPRPAPRRRAPAKAADGEEATPRPAPRHRPRATAPTAEGDATLAALQEQNENLTRLVELQEQTIERLSQGPGGGGGLLPRVGIFVDSANVELARDRSRGGKAIDWGIVLKRLTEDRRLVRAIAYSPVHDDPGVSRETQRFVEPFLGKGYKIVTKPLKRFADGSIKANVDIELALDVITMADRLDVAVLISGDGDFQPLVEALQSRGVRVEVAGLGPSVANSLKHAADDYIELAFAQKAKG